MSEHDRYGQDVFHWVDLRIFANIDNHAWTHHACVRVDAVASFAQRMIGLDHRFCRDLCGYSLLSGNAGNCLLDHAQLNVGLWPVASLAAMQRFGSCRQSRLS
jgi:hypothetical protein